MQYKMINVTVQEQTGNLREPSRTKRHSNKKTGHSALIPCVTCRNRDWWCEKISDMKAN